MKFKDKIKNNSGVAILIIVLVIGVLISIVTVLTGIFSVKIRLSSETKYSVGAVYAAESGIECCIYRLRDPAFDCSLITPNSIGASFDTGATCDTNDIKSIGNYNGVSRTLEVGF
jgi:hypothetical protein